MSRSSTAGICATLMVGLVILSPGCARDKPQPSAEESEASQPPPAERVQDVEDQSPGEFGRWLVGNWLSVDASRRQLKIAIDADVLTVRAGGARGPLTLIRRRINPESAATEAVDVSFAYGTRLVHATLRRLGPDSALVSIHGLPISVVVTRLK
jgi:hypothetical protein